MNFKKTHIACSARFLAAPGMTGEERSEWPRPRSYFSPHILLLFMEKWKALAQKPKILRFALDDRIKIRSPPLCILEEASFSVIRRERPRQRKRPKDLNHYKCLHHHRNGMTPPPQLFQSTYSAVCERNKDDYFTLTKEQVP